MHRANRIAEVLALADTGRTATEVAGLTGLPRSTVRGWIGGALPRSTSGGGCPTCRGAEHEFAALPAEYMYLLGIYPATAAYPLTGAASTG